MNGIDQGQTILMALLIIVPVLGLSYRHQIKLNLKLIEAERVRDNYREGMNDALKEHGALIRVVTIAVEMLRQPAELDAPVGDVLDILNDALGREDGDYGEDIDWRHAR